jgi:hypothetical protein
LVPWAFCRVWARFKKVFICLSPHRDRVYERRDVFWINHPTGANDRGRLWMYHGSRRRHRWIDASRVAQGKGTRCQASALCCSGRDRKSKRVRRYDSASEHDSSPLRGTYWILLNDDFGRSVTAAESGPVTYLTRLLNCFL